MAGRLQAGIGDEQHALAAQLARQLAQARQGAGAEDDARQRMEIESGQAGGGNCGLERRWEDELKKLPAFGDSNGSGRIIRDGSVGCPLRTTNPERRVSYCTTIRVRRESSLRTGTPGAEQEIDDVAFVRLQPVQLDRRDRPEVQPVDVRRVEQAALELLVLA